MHRSHENYVINKEQEVRYNVFLCNISGTRSGTSDLFKEGNIFWFISASRNGEEKNRMEFLKGNKRLHRQMPDREP